MGVRSTLTTCWYSQYSRVWPWGRMVRVRGAYSRLLFVLGGLAVAGQMCRAAGLGDEPRKVWEKLSQVRLVVVVLPTRDHVEIRKCRVSLPEKHQAILLQRLKLNLPKIRMFAPVSKVLD